MDHSQSKLDITFHVSIFLKGLDGVLEIIGGLFLLLPHETINGIVNFLTLHELSQDPHDLIANYIVTMTHHLNGSVALFGFLYLLSHGLVKIILVSAVLKNKLWAYPWMIAFLLLFIVYQLYQILGTFSLGLTLLTAFDVFVTVLTWIEYRKKQALSTLT
jgi:uncharacterized membrane protein